MIPSALYFLLSQLDGVENFLGILGGCDVEDDGEVLVGEYLCLIDSKWGLGFGDVGDVGGDDLCLEQRGKQDVEKNEGNGFHK